MIAGAAGFPHHAWREIGFAFMWLGIITGSLCVVCFVAFLILCWRAPEFTADLGDGHPDTAPVPDADCRCESCDHARWLLNLRWIGQSDAAKVVGR